MGQAGLVIAPGMVLQQYEHAGGLPLRIVTINPRKTLKPLKTCVPCALCYIQRNP